MNRLLALRVAVLAWAVAAASYVAHAALPIDLEVVATQSAPFGAMHEWGRVLNDMDLARVRLRGANRGDKPSITSSGAGASQRFRVVGVLNNRDELVLPGGVFAPGNIAGLKHYFQGLPRQAMEQGVERGIFGLTRPQFETIYRDLAVPVEAPTKGAPLAALLESIKPRVRTPIDVPAEAAERLARAAPLEVELQGFSAGTVLAMALRQAGLELAPLGPTLDTVALRVVPATRAADHWPIGWKPAELDRVLAPTMYQFTTIEINGFTLEQALAGGLAPHMGMPLVYDEQVLAEKQIDPSKIPVKFPRMKTFIRRAVDNCLSQARLAGEVRVDEANKPFYWITRFGPDSPRALGAEPPPEASSREHRQER